MSTNEPSKDEVGKKANFNFTGDPDLIAFELPAFTALTDLRFPDDGELETCGFLKGSPSSETSKSGSDSSVAVAVSIAALCFGLFVGKFLR